MKLHLLPILACALLAACGSKGADVVPAGTITPPAAVTPPEPLPPDPPRPPAPIGEPGPPVGDTYDPPYYDEQGPDVCTINDYNNGTCKPGHTAGGVYLPQPGAGFFWVWDGTQYVLTPDPHYTPPSNAGYCWYWGPRNGEWARIDNPACNSPPQPETPPDTAPGSGAPPASSQPVTLELRASSAVIAPGSVAVLTWTATGADTCTLSNSRNFWPPQLAGAADSYTTPPLPATSEVTLSCKRHDMSEAQATRTTLTLTVRDDSPGCEATDSCEAPPYQFGHPGTYSTSGAWCRFTASDALCVVDRAGRRAIFEAAFTAPGTLAGRSCYADGGAPTGDYVALLDGANLPVRLSLYIAPEFSFVDMRPADEWPDAPHCMR